MPLCVGLMLFLLGTYYYHESMSLDKNPTETYMKYDYQNGNITERHYGTNTNDHGIAIGLHWGVSFVFLFYACVRFKKAENRRCDNI